MKKSDSFMPVVLLSSMALFLPWLVIAEEGEEPKDAYALVDEAEVLLRNGELEESRALLRRALQLDPDNPEASVFLKKIAELIAEDLSATVDSESKGQQGDGPNPALLQLEMRLAGVANPTSLRLPGLTPSVPEMIKIPGGTFAMGKKGKRQVEVSPFWMSKTEITFRDYEYFLAMTSRQRPYPTPSARELNMPVIALTWEDAKVYCIWLSQETGMKFDLPTEAQWEYACRAGKSGNYLASIEDTTWYRDNSGDDLHPVGTKRPNEWGLHDMLGNVEEWCLDKKRLGTQRASRGCSFESRSADCVCWKSNALISERTVRWWFVGFRVVMIP